MLVARFPEFDHQGERLLLKLPPTLWHDKSSAAKDLLKRLMCYDPEQRLSAAEALRHEWLAEYRWVDVEMAGPGPNSERDDGMLLSRKQSCDESIGHKSSSSDAEYQNSTISLRPGFLFPTHQSTYQSNITYHDGVNQEHSNEQRTVGYSNMITYDMHLPLLPLLQLQRFPPPPLLFC
jgi:serine/threonine protein kinase